ncbi:MAG TPA: hypothetical protein VIT85_06655 [Solirubrobacterales bacterium]
MSLLRKIVSVCALTAVLVAATAAFGAENGLYRGSVVGDSGQDLRVKVKNGRVVKFLANVDASCGFADLTISVVYPPVGAPENSSIRIRGNGKFKATFVGNPEVPDDIRTIAGKFNGRNVNGTIKVVGPCTSEDRYRASR